MIVTEFERFQEVRRNLINAGPPEEYLFGERSQLLLYRAAVQRCAVRLRNRAILLQRSGLGESTACHELLSEANALYKDFDLNNWPGDANLITEGK